MIGDGLYWGSPSKPIELVDSVEVKVEHMEKAKRKKDNYHSKTSRLLLGDIISSAVGGQVDTILPSGRRSNAKKKVFGRILESVSNNKYIVSYTDGQINTMGSRQLKKATEEEVALYHQAVSELVGDTENIVDIADDSSIDPKLLLLQSCKGYNKKD